MAYDIKLNVKQGQSLHFALLVLPGDVEVTAYMVLGNGQIATGAFTSFENGSQITPGITFSKTVVSDIEIILDTANGFSDVSGNVYYGTKSNE